MNKDVTTKTDLLKNTIIAVVATGVLTTGAHAESTIDVSTIVNTFKTDITTAVSAVGMALLAVAGVAIVFKWVKASFFS